MPQITKALEHIELGQKQIKILAILLQSGPMFASAIARAAKLNRSTTYVILKELQEKGLVSSAKESSATRYQSIAPELLPGYIERKREELAESKKEIEEMLPQIKLLRQKRGALPKVQFFEGKGGVEQAYEDTLENNSEKSLRDITGVDAVFTNVDQKFLKYYLEKRAQLGIRCQNIAPESEWARKSKEDDEKYLRTTKFIPAKFNFDGEVSIYGNKVGLFSYAHENPIALIIEDATIAKMMKQIFDFVESAAK
ncbi:MAG TPA: helix-turn-helix domain-containing protein [Candidatus Paceibacterota bacterium]